jgi:HAD superfamily hydrolase (TIGR01509 family)
VVFDLDGLMFNTEDLYQEVGRTILARRGHEFNGELIDQMMGRQTPIALQIMIDYCGLSDTVAELAAESRAVMDTLLDTLQPMPGLVDLLDALEAARMPKAIATGSNRYFLDKVMDLSGLRPRFAFTLTSEDVEHGKPAPDIYLRAAQLHGLHPAEILVLEDSQIGCQAAVAAGTYAVAVPSGQSLSHQFPGVQYIARSLEDNHIYRLLRLDS